MPPSFQRRLGLTGEYSWEYVDYDLKDLAWVVWFALIIGAPGVFFLVYSKKLQAEEDERFRSLHMAPLEERIKEKETRIENEIHHRFRLQHFIKEQEEEIKRLKAREEFLTKKEPTPAEPSAPPKPKGVLEGNDL